MLITKKVGTIFFLIILDFTRVRCTLTSRFDGWYNNLDNPQLGSKGYDLLSTYAPDFEDLTYRPSHSHRPSPRYVSNVAMSGPSGLPSRVNASVLFAFFGQMVAYEMVQPSDKSCPVETLTISVPTGDPDFDPEGKGNAKLPFIRSGYNKKTGFSPNSPRRPINSVTSWLDGNFVYGNGLVWCNCLRSFEGGKLKVSDLSGRYPSLNTAHLPMNNFPTPMNHQLQNPGSFWMFGDAHMHQNPGLLAIGLVWFRWHNLLAERFSQQDPDLNDQQIFLKARKWVIANIQNIVVNEWLPVFLGKPLQPYPGYKKFVDPGVTTLFEAAAFRIGHSLIPPGIYLRNKKCNFTKVADGPALRLCNTYWRSQELILKHGLDEFLLGMTSQIAEREDHVVVSDLRGKCFGPLHFSRTDLVSTSIMRGRDHGLPDYNSARKSFGLREIKRWEDINPQLYKENPEIVLKLKTAYNGSLDTLDVYPGGMIESAERGPGELFSKIIEDQFTRVRDADRMWFANKQNGLFTDKEIEDIKKMKFRDIILQVTNVDQGDIPENVFLVPEDHHCPQPSQLKESDMAECTPHRGYDYFSGSEVTYIGLFTFIGILPFLCILAVYLLAQCKKFQTKRNTRNRYLDKLSSTCHASDGNIAATEWVGKDEFPRSVQLRFAQTDCVLHVLSSKGSKLRTVDLTQAVNLTVWVSADKNRDFLLIHLPNEYDLVLKLNNKDERANFLALIRNKLLDYGKPMDVFEETQSFIFKRAFTKAKRATLLEQFFKNVFAEALRIDQSSDKPQIESDDRKDILQCELSKTEFAEALALSPTSSFIEYMFSLLDFDKNGSLSFRELLQAVILFSKGSKDDKMKMLFSMYDTDQSGSLCKSEVEAMIRSFLDIASAELSDEYIDKLIANMFGNTRLSDECDITYHDFRKALDTEMFADLSLDWRANKNPRGKPAAPKGEEKPAASETGVKMKNGKTESEVSSEAIDLSSPDCSPNTENKKRYAKKKVAMAGKSKAQRRRSISDAVDTTPEFHSSHALLNDAFHYVQNNGQSIVYLMIFWSICCGLFLERFYYYSVEQEHVGLRRVAGYGVSLTRGAAASMSFCFSFILLTMCRNTITKLRETFLNLYIPFDMNVAFHKVVAWTALVFTAIHIIGYGFNFYHIATQPSNILCVFKELYFRSDVLPKLHFWFFMTATGLTGVLLVITICVIYIFATQTARRLIFSAFWMSHKLIYVLYILILMHGASRVVQSPYYHFYFLGPAVLFTLDKMVSLSGKRKALTVIKAELLPSDITRLVFQRPVSFEFKSGQWIRLACETQGENEYHPFTLTSSPHERTLSCHIRSVGPWTNMLRTTFDPENIKDGVYPKLYVDGPYGAGQQDWHKFDVSVLVGGGIGVTPYASILKDFVFMSTIKSTYRVKCQKVYFIWVTASQRHFEWLIDILKQVEDTDVTETIQTHIFITQFFNKFDLRTSMLYMCEQHFQNISRKSLFTGLRAKTHFGRPQFDQILCAIHDKHPSAKKVGVFSCGPPGVTKSVQKGCFTASKMTKARFLHHFENF